MKKYRKKPVVIEAVRFDGTNEDQILSFASGCKVGVDAIFIPTLEGTMRADVGDYIIRGVNDEFYPCKPDIFQKTYEEVDAGMDFGAALKALKGGKKVARKGWNGKGMWLVLVNSRNYSVDAVRSGSHSVLPWIGMKTADDFFVPWLASQTDMLAEDWDVVE